MTKIWTTPAVTWPAHEQHQQSHDQQMHNALTEVKQCIHVHKYHWTKGDSPCELPTQIHTEVKCCATMVSRNHKHTFMHVYSQHQQHQSSLTMPAIFTTWVWKVMEWFQGSVYIAEVISMIDGGGSMYCAKKKETENLLFYFKLLHAVNIVMHM